MNWNDWRVYVFIGLALVLLFLIARFIGITVGGRKRTTTRFVARVAIFGALSAVLYVVPVFQVHLPFLPPFLAIHFDEVPVFIASFAYGPWAGIGALAIKTLIKLPMTSTLAVGELADFIFSAAFILPAAIIYKKRRNLKGVAIGFTVSFFVQLIVSLLLNIYAILPFYMFVMGFSYDALLAMCQAANPAVKELGWTYGIYFVVPLNVIKNAIVLAVTFLIYRYTHKLLRFETKN